MSGGSSNILEGKFLKKIEATADDYSTHFLRSKENSGITGARHQKI